MAEDDLHRLPALEALRPFVRSKPLERLEARGAAFDDAVDEQMINSPRPCTTDAWVHPDHLESLRRWMAALVHDDPTKVADRFAPCLWELMSSSASEHVPLGHVIVTSRESTRPVRP